MNSGAEGLYYVMACAPTVAGLCCEWRMQYIVTIVAVMYVIALAAIWVGHGFTLVAPLISTVLVLNSRGVIRLLLHSLQERPYYGWYVTALASLSAAGLQWLLLAPYNVHLPFAIYLGLSALMQLATVPWLIKRKPGSNPTYWPCVTLGLMAAFWLIAFLVFAYEFRGYTPH